MENQGVTTCESFTPGPNQLRLIQRNTNNIVAIGQLFNAPAATRAQCECRMDLNSGQVHALLKRFDHCQLALMLCLWPS